ncbi:tRNA1(Val) (adenine(37)-N6)-methyltransferase [Galbibacter sp.]|jgi:tRNA1Val (adenine37-N6)-methyltransferase|uniref:tRNA1(Val) (adenine(37)-N6)-methyltransferase n=1 Tax=Galbibacter sp. TaxID=2918471 RepID=UPI003A93B3B2
MSKKPFRFKAFEVHQDLCAMKIGTASVLLGAWADITSNPYSILDIGAGTGILGLMMGQRTSAELIDGIEIEPDAFEQCVENFDNSPYFGRLFCFHTDLNEFVEEVEDQYDFIICNPPFFSENTASPDPKRDRARRVASLPFEELVLGVSKLLTPQGQFNTIIPYKEHLNFIDLAENVGLYPSRLTYVKGTPDRETKLVLMAFSFHEVSAVFDKLVIELERHVYTEEYINLTKDFYLDM